MSKYRMTAHERKEYVEALQEERAELARDVERLEREIAETRAAVHPAFKAIASHLEKQSWDATWGTSSPATNQECLTFALTQIEKIGKAAAEALKPELRSIYADVRRRGGDAYGEHKARLQELNKK